MKHGLEQASETRRATASVGRGQEIVGRLHTSDCRRALVGAQSVVAQVLQSTKRGKNKDGV